MWTPRLTPAYRTFRVLDTSPTTWTLRLLDSLPNRQFAYEIFRLLDTSPRDSSPTRQRLLRGQFAHSMWAQDWSKEPTGDIFYTTGNGNPSIQMRFSVQLRSSWQDFNSRAVPLIAELLVLQILLRIFYVTHVFRQIFTTRLARSWEL